MTCAEQYQWRVVVDLLSGKILGEARWKSVPLYTTAFCGTRKKKSDSYNQVLEVPILVMCKVIFVFNNMQTQRSINFSMWTEKVKRNIF